MKKNTLFWILRRIRGRIPAMVLLCLSQVFHALLGVVFALRTRGLVDSAVSGDSPGFLRDCLWLAGVIGLLLLVSGVQRHLRDHLQAELDRDWKRGLLSVLLRGDYAAVSRYHTGELVNRMTNDVRTVNDALVNVLPGVLGMAVRLAAAFGVLAALDPVFTLVIAGCGCLVLVSTALLRRRLKKLHKKVSEHDGIVQGFLQEVLEKLLIVQALDVAPQVEKQGRQQLDARFEAQRKRKNLSLAANLGVSGLSLGVSFLALAWCALRLLRGQMSFGSLTAVTQLVNQLRSPVVGLSGVLTQYAALTASAERLMELEELSPPQPDSRLTAGDVYSRLEAIRGEKLSFSFEREAVLNHVDFRIPKGTFGVITGASGKGKSTLLKLLLGIYPPEQGQLYLDCGETRYPIDSQSRSLFAYVPQGNLLLSGTLRENLLLANPEAGEEQIALALRVSAMDEFLPALPQGLDTVIGESGMGLSEGQAQRLAIARGVLRDAPILLLDEATSALDEKTEERVLQALAALPGRTCVAVTHRSAALALCHWHLEVREGALYPVEGK